MKEKNIKTLNEVSKGDILQTIQALKTMSDNQDVVRALDAFRKSAESFGSDASISSYKKLEEVKSNLAKAKSAIKNNMPVDATYYVEDSTEILKDVKAAALAQSYSYTKAELKQRKKAQKTQAKLNKALQKEAKAGSEEAQSSLALTARLEETNEKYNETLARLKRIAPRVNQGNSIANSEWIVNKQLLNTYKTNMNAISGEIERNSIAAMTAAVKENYTFLKENRIISTEQMQRDINDVERMAAEHKEDVSQARDIANRVANIAKDESVTLDTVDLNGTVIHDSLLDELTKDQKTQSDIEDIEDIFEEGSHELKRVNKLLDTSINKYEKALNKVNDKLLELNDEAKDLLEERKSLTDSERIAFDSKLTKLIAQRETIKRAILRYRNQIDNLVNKKRIVEASMISEDINKLNDKIVNLTSGKLGNVNDLVKDVVDSIEQSNKALDESNLAVDTMDLASPIKNNSLDDSATNEALIRNITDEDTIKNLEEELKIK